MQNTQNYCWYKIGIFLVFFWYAQNIPKQYLCTKLCQLKKTMEKLKNTKFQGFKNTKPKYNMTLTVSLTRNSETMEENRTYIPLYNKKALYITNISNKVGYVYKPSIVLQILDSMINKYLIYLTSLEKKLWKNHRKSTSIVFHSFQK